MRNDFIQFCNRLSPLNKEATKDLFDVLKYKSIKKNDYLLKCGEVCRHLYFIDEGLTKTYFINKGKDFIMKFFSENSMFTVLDSFLSQAPSKYMVLALEPTTITYITHTELEALCKKHHCFETFFRKVISLALTSMMKRISETLERNATERYHDFVNGNPSLIQRISLGDLASYLGITQVSLSRIRARK
jgi:CRP-like cAMP-binding protein